MQSSTQVHTSQDDQQSSGSALHLFLGADHGGFEAKEQVTEWLSSKDVSHTDLGAFSLEPTDDYPPIAIAVSEAVAKAQAQDEDGVTSLGVLFCRSGGGMSIAANKVKGIRAVPVLSVKEAKHAREHNDAQIISVSADWLTQDEIQAIIQAFISTPASEDPRHVRRVAQIKEYEERA